MTEIAQVQARLHAALDRIGAGLVTLEAPAPEPEVDPAAMDALQEALSAERAAVAEQKDLVAELETKLTEQADVLARQERDHQIAIDRLKQELQDTEIQSARMRRTNTQLRQSIQALREAAEAGVTEPHLINQAMMSELEGLRVAREGDRAEMDAILGELKPLIEEDANA